jgi:hypothetical protein
MGETKSSWDTSPASVDTPAYDVIIIGKGPAGISLISINSRGFEPQ